MRGLLAYAAMGAALFAGSAAAAAPSVQIKDAVARVTVIPEDRADVKVEFLTSNPSLPLEVRQAGGETIVDGNIRSNRIYSCTVIGGKTRVGVRDIGQVGYDDIPQVVVRTPRQVDVSAGGAVFGTVGRSAGLKLANAGCGDWTVGNVTGPMKLRHAGSGATRAGTAASADISIAGSGDVATQAIGGDVSVNIAGSGDVSIASVAGALNTNIAGSGDIHVAGGRATAMAASVAGSGDVVFGGVADSLSARVMGSGDIRAAKVNGAVSKSVMGSGDVSVGD